MLDSNDLINAVASVIMRSGYFEIVNQFEPKSSPGTGLSAAVWAQNIRPSRTRSTLEHTAVRVAFSCRIFMNMIHDPLDEIEPTVMEAADWIMNAFTGDFSLDGISDDRVELDLLGSDGIPLSAEAGYISVGGAMQRIYDITVPLVIYDVWEQIR